MQRRRYQQTERFLDVPAFALFFLLSTGSRALASAPFADDIQLQQRVNAMQQGYLRALHPSSAGTDLFERLHGGRQLPFRPHGDSVVARYPHEDEMNSPCSASPGLYTSFRPETIIFVPTQENKKTRFA